MDKNSVTGLILIALILGIFWWVNKPTEEQLVQQKKYRDSIENVQLKLQQEEAARKLEARQKEIQDSIAYASLPDSIINKQKESKYGLLASAIEGTNKFYTLENKLLKVTLSSKGAKVYKVQLKKYKDYQGNPLILFDGDKNSFGFDFSHNNKFFNTNDLYFSLDQSASNDSTLSFMVDLGNNKKLSFNYTLPENNYMVNFDINQKNLNDVILLDKKGFNLKWDLDLFSHEKGRKFELQYSGVFYQLYEDKVDDISITSPKEETIETPIKWLAYKDQFFSSVLIANDKFSSAKINVKGYNEEDKTPILSTNKSTLLVPSVNSANSTTNFKFFFGPNEYKTLRKYKDIELERLVPLGWGIFGWINRFIVIPIFNWLGSFIGNYGLIIFLLTLIIKIGLFPLTYKSYLSTAKMRVLKPQIDAINEKIPKDKAMERQQATMALYSKAGVSPLGGCLPMLLQMPILFAMYKFFPASIELRQESFLWATDLSTYDSIFSWTENIPILSSIYGNHISLFTLLMAITNIIYTRINQEMTQSSSQMPGMKNMMYIMPVMFLFIFNNFASGLSYYYFISTLITIIQTVIIRRFVDEDAILAKLNANQKKPGKKKSNFQKRLEEMAKQQQQQRKKKNK